MSECKVETIVRPGSVNEVVQCVRDHARLQLVGAQTKPAMTASKRENVRCMMTGLSNVVDHQPAEFLITASAGTSLAELQSMLAEHGQYMPFDPPFARHGATIGGTVAAGLSGAGRLRFGGLRDFIVGVKFVDGMGNVVTGGGKVVKNAAGYDLPKLLVGSGGLLGAIVEVTLKVFPQPQRQRTLWLQTSDIKSAIAIQTQLSRSPIDLAAIDLTPEGSLWLRIEGEQQSLETTTARIQSLLQQGEISAGLTTIENASGVWNPLDDGSFAPSADRLVRVPLAPTQLLAIDTSLEELCVSRRRYSVAGNLVWIAWPASRPIQQLDECLRHHQLGGTILRGEAPRCRIGLRPNTSMMKRVKTALDPDNRFVGD